MVEIDIMQVAFQVIVLFLIMFIGIYARKLKIIDQQSTKVMSGLLLNVTQPLLIIISFQMEFDKNMLKSGLFVLMLSAIIHLALSATAYFIFKLIKNRGESKIYEFAFIFTNCAYIGYPVLKSIFGDNLGIFYGSFYTMFFNLYVWTYGVVILERGNDGVKKMDLKKSVLNAGVVASVIGIFLFVTGIRLPSAVYNAAKLVGDMTFPLSMIIIGSIISSINIMSLLKQVKVYIFIFVKMFVLPAVALLICKLLRTADYITYIAVIMTCLPTGVVSAMFAQNHDCDEALASQLVGLTTFVSIGSIPLVLIILGRFI